MSLRVNTNVTAMNAYRNVGATNDEYSKSINRLSTGLRINSAADDPAGLILSEGLRAQVAGIDQAIRNNQDAVNYAKTAEGALDEVNRLLRDARSLAVASGNTGTMTASQIQANQSQLNSIVSSISRIASTTSFGGKKLLDGSAGVQTAVVDAADYANVSLSGNWNGAGLYTTSAVTVDISTSATKATVTSDFDYSATDDLVAAGTLSINGTTFTTDGTESVATVMAKINNMTAQTGVVSTFDGTNFVFTATRWGTAGNFVVQDATGDLVKDSAAGSFTATGVDPIAAVSVDVDGTGANAAVAVTFTGGRMGLDAFVLSDNYGNRITLTETGNANTAATKAADLVIGSSAFQIGGNAGETASMSLGNFAASQLGKGIVANKNLSNIDVTTASTASDALKVIDAAIAEVATKRGEVGSFQRNVLESNIRSLGVAKENLSATESTIRDTDVAAEMTNFTKLQILQQAGMAMLAQANSAPNSVLALLRG